MSERIVCPVHGIPDCSPLLNGCSLVNQFASVRALREALAQYRSALRSGEPESEEMRQIGDEALGLGSGS